MRRGIDAPIGGAGRSHGILLAMLGIVLGVLGILYALIMPAGRWYLAMAGFGFFVTGFVLAWRGERRDDRVSPRAERELPIARIVRR